MNEPNPIGPGKSFQQQEQSVSFFHSGIGRGRFGYLTRWQAPGGVEKGPCLVQRVMLFAGDCPKE
jgi:hypothetical protein